MNNIFKSSKDIEEENARLQEELEATKEQAQRIERTSIIATIAIGGIGVATSAVATVKNAKLKVRAKRAEDDVRKLVDEISATKATAEEKANINSRLNEIFNNDEKVTFTDFEEFRKAKKAEKEKAKEEKKAETEEETKDTAYEEIAENKNNEDIPESVSGEEEKGFLHAEWNDTEYERQEYKGYVSADVNFPCESIQSDDKLEIIESYYELFDRLKDAGAIRRATLRMNGKIIHEWNGK